MENLKLPRGVSVLTKRFSVTLSQEGDDMQDVIGAGQDIEISTENSGAGNYLVLQTDRWAMDAKEIDQFAKILKDILKSAE